MAYKTSKWMIESVSAEAIAEAFGTPCYVYSKKAIEESWLAYQRAFGEQSHKICYAVKACSNIAVLNLLAELGSHFDIVSGGELERVIRAGGKAEHVVFSGVGKSIKEIERALELGVGCFNIESLQEFHRIESLAKKNDKVASISVRVNPDIDAQTHPYISTGLKDNKFGVDSEVAKNIYRLAKQSKVILIKGIDCHIGSQITELSPMKAAAAKLSELLVELAKEGIKIHEVNCGGGLGICYQDEHPPEIADWVGVLCNSLGANHDVTLMVEPGRSIVGPAGTLLTTVEYIKSQGEKQFAIVDAAVNDLMRPALYQAWHTIVPAIESEGAPATLYDVVGPVCESSDYLGHDRTLSIQAGDVLCVCDVGAYGATMSSNYNSRTLIPEILVDGDDVYPIRVRQTYDALLSQESLISELAPAKI